MKLISEKEATGKTKEIYREIKSNFGMVPNLFQAMAAVSPGWLEMNWQREKKIMLDDGPLDRKYRELIAFAVSVVNNCEYCTLAHESIAGIRGASKEETGHARQVIELFAGFNAIANSFHGLPCDIVAESL